MFTRPARALGILLAVLVATATVSAQPTRVIVAKSNSPAATFSARPAAGNVFSALGDKADLYAGDIIVSLPGGTLTSKNGAVAVKSLADFDAKSPLPILETAVSLAESEKGTDLDLVLDRGRVDITNVRADGPATVRVRFWDESWKVVLDSPNTRVAVELCGRWPVGSRFKPTEPGADAGKQPRPVASLVLLVLKGSATVSVGTTTLGMKAPPGPAELRWNSLLGVHLQVQKLEKLPEWADPGAALSDHGKKVAAACEKFRSAFATDSAKAFDTFIASTDPIEQRVAIVSLGGLDDLERLGKALVAAKTTEEWDFGITILRHWIGRGKGQDQRLYNFLVTRREFTDAQAQIVLQLLFGFSPDDAVKPETYEVLIDYLVHEKPGIRNLAAWHLVRLVPKGKEISFKPDGTLQDFEKYHAAWKKLVPSGDVPPTEKRQ